MIKKILLSLVSLILLLAAAGATIGWWISTPTSQAELARMQASDYFHDGAFANPEPQSGWDFKWNELVLAVTGGEEQTSPPGKIPVTLPNPTFLDSKLAPGLRAIWLGHSSVLLEIDGVRILLDPVLSLRVSPFSFFGPSRFHPSPIPLKDMRGIDVVLISHNHYDHMDEATIRHLAEQGTKFYLPLGTAPLLQQWGIGDTQIRSFNWWEEESIEGVRFVATPARHYSNRGTVDYKETFWLSWSIVGPQHRAFFSGDTGYSKSFAEIGKKLGPFDLGVIKVGAYGPGQAWIDIHMDPENAMKTAKDVGAKLVLPVHWGTFNLAYHAWDEPIERAVVAAQPNGIKLATPRPGEMVDAANPSAVTPWWRGVK